MCVCLLRNRCACWYLSPSLCFYISLLTFMSFLVNCFPLVPSLRVCKFCSCRRHSSKANSTLHIPRELNRKSGETALQLGTLLGLEMHTETHKQDRINIFKCIGVQDTLIFFLHPSPNNHIPGICPSFPSVISFDVCVLFYNQDSEQCRH